ELSWIGRHPYLTQPQEAQAQAFVKQSGADLNKIYVLLRNATGVDFAFYKQTTLLRRIKRRMVLHKINKLKDYLGYLQMNPREVRDLYEDFLIHVTGFFRDRGAFEVLRKKVFPKLMERRSSDSPIRIWVPGCSSGEEVYSIAISLLEYLSEKTGNPPLQILGSIPIQIFGTDVASHRIAIARSGVFPESVAADVSPERLKNVFVKLDRGGYQISKPIHEICLFEEQNAVKDPPFSRIDLISCRNLLIYLGPILQKRLIPIFHFALNPNGFLMLGSSESVGGFSEHFVLVDKKYKIYLKKKTGARMIPLFGAREALAEPIEGDKPPAALASGFALDKEADQILLSKYVPPSLVVTDNLGIVQFRGQVGRYLEPAAGEATLVLSKMARQDLLTDIRIVVGRAKKENTPVIRKGVGRSRDIDIEVVPIKGRLSQEKYYLILFHEPSSSPLPKPTKAA